MLNFDCATSAVVPEVTPPLGLFASRFDRACSIYDRPSHRFLTPLLCKMGCYIDSSMDRSYELCRTRWLKPLLASDVQYRVLRPVVCAIQYLFITLACSDHQSKDARDRALPYDLFSSGRDEHGRSRDDLQVAL